MHPDVEERNVNNMKERFSLEAIPFIQVASVGTSGVNYARHFQLDSK